MKITIPFSEYSPMPCPDYVSEQEHYEEILGDLLSLIENNFNCEFKTYYFTFDIHQNNKLKQWEITKIKK